MAHGLKSASPFQWTKRRLTPMVPARAGGEADMLPQFSTLSSSDAGYLQLGGAHTADEHAKNNLPDVLASW
ncbi:MAG: hypothetical protein ACYDH9_13490 [Limisphaerales bacterium]